MKKLRLLISGGGTGGHIFPAVAIANAVKEKYPDSEIRFVGAKGKMEMEKVPAEGYPIHGLWISGLQRSLDWRNLLLPFKLISSLWNSFLIVKKYKPHATVGVGGYASGPLNFVASSLGIPLLLQEQNSFPGLTNKLLKNKAKKICVAYPDMDQFFDQSKLVLTGNPIRQDLLKEVDPLQAYKHFGLDANKKTVLIIGGSLGARSVNKAIEKDLPLLDVEHQQLLWQTGKSFEGAEGNFAWGKRQVFIRRMDMAYAIADVVISRAGALSISELSALAKAVIFVPLPSAAEDHQSRNAQRLVDANAALLCPDSDALTQLMPLCLNLLASSENQKTLQAGIGRFAKKDAAAHILKTLESIIE